MEFEPKSKLVRSLSPATHSLDPQFDDWANFIFETEIAELPDRAEVYFAYGPLCSDK